MSELRFVKWPSRRGSVHVFVTFTRGGQVLTRCGRRFDELKVDLLESLPLGETSCESCLRLGAHDAQPDVANDEVTP